MSQSKTKNVTILNKKCLTNVSSLTHYWGQKGRKKILGSWFHTIFFFDLTEVLLFQQTKTKIISEGP